MKERNAITVNLLIFITITISCSNPVETTSVLKEPVLGMEFMLIPHGSLLMGDTASNTKPMHKVTISKDFWLGKTEVTQQQWQKIMGSNELHPEKPSPFRGKNPDFPVVSVSYYDVEKFLERLNGESGKYHFRLPTEAEWEYACRAGTTTPFSCGMYLTDAMANFNAEIPSIYSIEGKNNGQPTKVGSYAPNPWGLFDMHGNVFEWVSDWYDLYPEEEVTDPNGPETGIEKLIRGGSWYYGAENAKSSYRRTHKPDLWGFSIGFRIVCEIK
jgi:formylglycine-generating enzyme